MSIREDVELYTKLSGEDGSHETIATIGAYLRGYRQGKEDAEPHWIPVTERLPYAEYGESDSVLATCGYRDVEDGSIRWIKTLYFNGGNWCYPTGETYLEKVYAWMPLPEPAKLEND